MYRNIFLFFCKIVVVIVLIGMSGGLMSSMANAEEAQQKTSSIQIAITIDDLPWSGALPDDVSADQALLKIAAVLNTHKVQATGFVISDHAMQNESALQTWVKNGFTLGNHSATHPDLNRTSVDDWLADVVRCHEYLKKFGSAYKPYFRFPMLHQGNTLEKQISVQSALKEMELQIAHVTVDNSDWMLAMVHTIALKNKDSELRQEVRSEFIRHILAAIEHADNVARRKVGRSIPEVLLLHANALLEENLDALLAALEGKNIKFITLEKALEDPVYSQSDEYIGTKGLSWLYRIKPLSLDDVRWDDSEALAIEKHFKGALSNQKNLETKGKSRQNTVTDPQRGSAKVGVKN
jgi:peptidoglycan-N-acetylglucosamine deacetylase